MARFGKRSEADMLAALAEAEADSTDGLETETKRRPAKRKQEPAFRPVTQASAQQAPTPQRSQQAQASPPPRRQQPAPQRQQPAPRPAPQQPPKEQYFSNNSFDLDEVFKEPEPIKPEEPSFDLDDLSLDSLDDMFEDTMAEATAGPVFETEEAEFVPFVEDSLKIDAPIISVREPEPIKRPTPTVPKIEEEPPLKAFEEAPKSKFSHIRIPSSEPEIKEAPETANVQAPIRKPQERTRTDVELAALVIRLYDSIKRLKDDEREIAAQFISQEEGIANDYAKFAIAAINVDPMLTPTLSALTQAKEFDAVNRAFYIMGLEDDLLQSVGALSEVLSGGHITKDISDKIGYSRDVVAIIEGLANESMAYVEATESIVAVVKNFG